MHIFTYDFLQEMLLPPQLLTLAANISSLRVMAAQRREDYPLIFDRLSDVARVDSVKASNLLEGLVTTDRRFQEIVQAGSAPLNHTEAEIAGYRDVLNEIHGNWSEHLFSESEVQRFHAAMMELSSPGGGGRYKTEDNVIAERLSDGSRIVRFTPVSAAETPEAMRQWMLAYQCARDNSGVNQLLLIPCVILDFLCIHPFADGNGRLSRLLSLLLLYKSGYDVGKYISFERQINLHKVEYYQALWESSQGWSENDCHYLPFMIHFIMTLYSCYAELDKRFANVHAGTLSKRSRIEATLLNSLTPLAKREICEILPDVSPTTVEAVLGSMVRKGVIRRIGTGRATKYLRT